MDSFKQARYIRMMHNIFLGYSCYTLFLFFSYYFNVLNISTLEFITLITFIWTGNLSIYLFVRLGLNEKIKDPDLMLPLMVWSIICIIVPTYYMTEILRSVLIMNYFLIMIFGVFKLNFKQFINITLFSIALLSITITAVILTEEVNVYNEILIVAMFSVVALSFAFVCNKISELRQKLKSQKIELMNAFSDIQKISVTDELTGIYNRRYALNFISNQKIKADKGIDKFVICMIDIDHFKKINDTHGHDIGDLVLKAFSREVNHLIRSDDCFARFGGEEFVLILSHIDISISKEVVNRIMNKIREIRIPEVPELKITVSMGLVEYEKNTSLEELLKKSDNLLYIAKKNGRNQVKY